MENLKDSDNYDDEPTPYEILNLEEGASIKEIKMEYYRLSKIFHPDK